MPTTHPTETELQDFLLGKLPDQESEAVESHLAECPECLHRAANAPTATDTLVELLAAVRTLVDAERTAQVTPSVFADTRTLGGFAQAQPAAVPLPAELVDHPKYRLIRPLGVGGMGTVWLAEHTMMGRNVALKLVRPEWVAKPGAVERFRREVRAAARLTHPNIATAFDAEQVGDRHLLVMEHVPGESLAEVVRRGPLSVEEACRAVRDAARGLAHAHDAGLVHRDVKPSNLVRTPEGVTKVLDFGLATAAPGEDGLTGVNLVMGTPDYIAPEQAANPRAADPRSDIYALGCTLYHLLAGRVPYPFEPTMRKIDAHRDPAVRPPPLDVPVGVSAVVAKMMATHPADRYQTADEVAEAVEPFCQSGLLAPRAGSTPSRGTNRPRSRWVAGLVFAFLGLVLAGVVIYRIQTDKGELVIETTDDDVEVVVKQGGKVVTVFDPKSKQKLVLQSGTYEFELDGKPSGLKLDIDKATVKRGDTVVAKIERVVQTESKEKEVTSVEPQDEIRRFEGFTESIFAVALSSDGKTVAAGGGGRINNLGVLADAGKDFSIRTWDVATGKRQHRLIGHTNLVRQLAFSPDGKLLASCGHDRTIRLWDLETGKELEAFPLQPNTVFGLAFSPDGKSLASIGWNAQTRLWDVAGRKLVKEFDKFPRSTDAWEAVCFSPDGRKVAAGGWETLVVYDVSTGEIDRSIEQPGLIRVGDVSFSADGKRLVASGGMDHQPGTNVVRVWNVATGKEQWRTSGRLGTFASADGGTLFVGDAMGRPTTLWDVATDRPLAKYTGHADAIMSQAVSLKARIAVTGGNDGTVRLFRLPSSTATTPTGKPTAGIPAEGKLPLKPGEVFVFRGHTDGLLALAVSPDGRFAVTGGSFPDNKDSVLRMWNLETGKEVKQFRGHDQCVFNIAYSPDGKKLLSASGDCTARVWNVERGESTWLRIGRTDHWVFSGAFTRDGAQAIITSEKPRLFDLATEKDLDRFEKYAVEQVRAAALSPDGGTLATSEGSSGAASAVSLWDVKLGKRIKALAGHKSLVYSVAWSPDGRRLASASDDGTVRVWNPDGDSEVKRLEHPRPVNGVAYSPGGKFVLTGCYDHAVRVWDAASGELVHTLKGHELEVWTVGFTPDGKHALSVSQDKTMRMWRLPDEFVDPKGK